jgi:hypothetical protein
MLRFLFSVLIALPMSLLVGGIIIFPIQVHQHAMLSSDSTLIILLGSFTFSVMFLLWLFGVIIRYKEKNGGFSGFGG